MSWMQIWIAFLPLNTFLPLKLFFFFLVIGEHRNGIYILYQTHLLTEVATSKNFARYRIQTNLICINKVLTISIFYRVFRKSVPILNCIWTYYVRHFSSFCFNLSGTIHVNYNFFNVNSIIESIRSQEYLIHSSILFWHGKTKLWTEIWTFRSFPKLFMSTM